MAKKVIGKIYQQGSREAYFLRYKFQGKDNRIRLLDADGKPIYGTDDDGKALNRPEALKARREAESAADMLLSKIRIGDKAEQLRQLNNDLRDAEAAAIEAEGFTLHVKAPTKENPSITAAMDIFLKEYATRKR